MAKNTNRKQQRDADQMIAAAQSLEKAARRLKDRARALREGRSCESSPDSVKDLEWAAGDAQQGAREAAAFLVAF